MALAPGTNFGPYRILGTLGVGGMASVYHAFQANPPREVALKIISADLAEHATFRARFRREAASTALLEHPNIVPVFATGEVDGQPYICYRYIRGGTLKDRLSGPLPVAEVVALLTPVAEALDFAHSRGVVHRDIKPANILLSAPDAQGRQVPVVADFGIARLLEPALLGPEGAALASDDSTVMTLVGVGVGTPAYMAPEQVLGRALDGRADQYALAITAYQLLTGTVPFSATTPAELAYMHVSEPLPLPSSRNPAVAPAVEQALLTALARAPADRYPSCGAFITALAAAAETLPQPTPLLQTVIGPTPAPAPRSRAPRQRRMLAAGAGGLIVLLGVLVVVGFLVRRSSSTQRSTSARAAVTADVKGSAARSAVTLVSSPSAAASATPSSPAAQTAASATTPAIASAPPASVSASAPPASVSASAPPASAGTTSSAVAGSTLPACIGSRLAPGQSLACAAPAGDWNRQVNMTWQDSACPGAITVTFVWGDGSAPTVANSPGPCRGSLDETHLYHTQQGATETYSITTSDHNLPNPYLQMFLTFQ